MLPLTDLQNDSSLGKCNAFFWEYICMALELPGVFSACCRISFDLIICIDPLLFEAEDGATTASSAAPNGSGGE